MNILAFAASTSTKSINKQLVAYASSLLTGELAKDSGLENVEVEIIDLNDYEMPIYSSDREEAAGVPTAARAFLAKIAASDAVLISFAEHNGSYTAAYKNTFDWASRVEKHVYQGKPTVLLSTSPGRAGAASVLKTAVDSAERFGSELRGSLSVPSFNHSFDTEAGALSDADLDAQLRTTLVKLF